MRCDKERRNFYKIKVTLSSAEHRKFVKTAVEQFDLLNWGLLGLRTHAFSFHAAKCMKVTEFLMWCCFNIADSAYLSGKNKRVRCRAGRPYMLTTHVA